MENTTDKQPATVGSADLLGVDLIRAERLRQIEEEGWSPDHDNVHTKGEMAGAAAIYALHGCGFENPHILEARRPDVTHKVRIWPWADRFWKPSDRIRDLVKAGALIAAEIDRLQRKRSETPNSLLSKPGSDK